MKNSLFPILLILAFCSACSESTPKQATQEETPELTLEGDSITLDADQISDPIKIVFNCKAAESSTEETPLYDLSIQVNDKDYPVEQVNACELFMSNDDYERYKIPMIAITAAGGWWAGAGDYFYAVLQGEAVEVYKASQDEGQEATGFDYKKVKSISIN